MLRDLRESAGRPPLTRPFGTLDILLVIFEGRHQQRAEFAFVRIGASDHSAKFLLEKGLNKVVGRLCFDTQTMHQMRFENPAITVAQEVERLELARPGAV